VRWPWRHRAAESVEAREALAELEDLDVEVGELGRRLERVERRNNFSGMVALAISRAAQEGR
jgi:hypothetical protein